MLKKMLLFSPNWDLFTALCQNGDVRLAGSPDPLRGRVEVCVNQTWGTICEDFWDTKDSSVVCKQLGFAAAGMYIPSVHTSLKASVSIPLYLPTSL